MSDERREDWWDEFYDYDQHYERERCERCGGEGMLEYQEHPELWGEDCPSLKNHLVICPDCQGTGFELPPSPASEEETG